MERWNNVAALIFLTAISLCLALDSAETALGSEIHSVPEAELVVLDRLERVERAKIIYEKAGITQDESERRLILEIPGYLPFFKMRVWDNDPMAYMHTADTMKAESFKPSGAIFTSVTDRHTPKQIWEDGYLDITLELEADKNLEGELAYVFLIIREADPIFPEIIGGQIYVSLNGKALRAVTYYDRIIAAGFVEFNEPKEERLKSRLPLEIYLQAQQTKNPDSDLLFDVIIFTENVQSKQSFTLKIN